MHTEAVIRTATLDDGRGITSLTNELGYPSSEDKVCQILEMVLAHPDHQIYIAESNTTIAGYIHLVCTMRMGSDPFVEIAALFVHDEFQNRGIGTALINDAEKWAQQKGYQVLRIRSNIVRKKAHAFFERHGFVNLKTQEVFRKQLS
jgi:GNAT superfamily N-acetyltransferase